MARLDMDAKRWDTAALGYARAIAANVKVARDPGVWVEYAEARAMIQLGSLSGQPTALISKALSLDPHHPKALELAGSSAWEQRDYAQAADYWERLLRLTSPADSRHAELSRAIRDARRRARVALP